MQKPITPRIHGMIDYATVLATAAAPTLLGFPARAATLAYGLAGSYLGLSAVTDYPLSARRMVPFRTHGIAEAVSGMALPAMPWALGFARHRGARNFFLGLTGLTFAVAALTDWGKRQTPPEDA
ncbi:MAG TPA: hypothetical protein VF746_08030 [Longimicrobium sp.]|jgi:hypothetical protein